MTKLDLVGQKFERLTVVRRAPKNRISARWECLCNCGNTSFVQTHGLRGGSIKSCGCLNRELSSIRARKHGMTGSPEYIAWEGMLARCSQLRPRDFAIYGARGITVCDRWKSFENFYADMGSRPSKLHSLDRKDNETGYSPENCRWATRDQQANNRRTNVRIEFRGKQMTVSQMIKLSGTKTPERTIRGRLKNGWSPELAITHSTERT